MLIDKTKSKNKVVIQAITKAAATALEVEPGGISPAPRYVRSMAKL